MFSSNYSVDRTELCRFCAQVKCKTTLICFTENEEEFRKCLNILEFLNVHYVDFSPGDTLPKNICDSCYTSLINSYEFFKKVLQSQTDLSELSLGNKVKIEAIDVETCYLPEYTSTEPHTSQQQIITRSKSKKATKNHRQYKRKVKIQSSDSESDNEVVYAGVPVFIERNLSNQDNISLENNTSDSGSEYDLTYAGFPVFNYCDKGWSHYSWKCSYCHNRFDTLMLLRSHSINTHNNCYAYMCEDCECQCELFDEFIEHVRSHWDNLRYYCKYCDHYNESINDCIQHEKNHTDNYHPCLTCGELFESEISLSKHRKKALASKVTDINIKIDSDDSLSSVEEPIDTGGMKIPSPDYEIETWKDYPWICPICQLAFLSIDQWRAHGRNKHGKCASYKCFDCKRYRCKKLRHLIAHIRKHRIKLSLQCHFCYEVKTNEESLQKHITGHLQNYFWCEFCGEKFIDEHDLQTHLKKFRKKILIKRTTPLTVEDLTCKVCLKITKNQRALTVHQRIHGDHYYACEVCGQTFNSKSNLSIHLSRHDKKYICDLCNKPFPTRWDIIRHIENHDTKPFACLHCGYKSRTKVALKRHQIKHSTVLPFVCQICNKAFKTSLYLRKHSLQHTGEKPYLCKFCHKAFANTSNCHKHMKRIHKEFKLQTKPRSILDINIDSQ